MSDCLSLSVCMSLSLLEIRKSQIVPIMREMRMMSIEGNSIFEKFYCPSNLEDKCTRVHEILEAEHFHTSIEYVCSTLVVIAQCKIRRSQVQTLA